MKVTLSLRVGPSPPNFDIIYSSMVLKKASKELEVKIFPSYFFFRREVYIDHRASDENPWIIAGTELYINAFRVIEIETWRPLVAILVQARCQNE